MFVMGRLAVVRRDVSRWVVQFKKDRGPLSQELAELRMSFRITAHLFGWKATMAA